MTRSSSCELLKQSVAFDFLQEILLIAFAIKFHGRTWQGTSALQFLFVYEIGLDVEPFLIFIFPSNQSDLS